MTDPTAMLTTRQFAGRVRLECDTIKRYCQDGTIRAQKFGGRNGVWLIPKAEVKRFKERGNT